MNETITIKKKTIVKWTIIAIIFVLLTTFFDTLYFKSVPDNTYSLFTFYLVRAIAEVITGICGFITGYVFSRGKK